MSRDAQIAEAMLQVAREIHTQHDLGSTMDAIVHSAQRSLPGLDHVGISIVHRRGDVETVAGTDPLVWELDDMQYRLGEGPCIEAIRTAPVTLANTLRHDQRWPAYAALAVERGVVAQMAVRLYIEDETLGSLNLYSTCSEVIDPDLQHVATLFAAHAALALGRARHEEELNTALGTRKIIGQALGILMERYQLDEDRAFQFMVRVSQASNVKLRDIAQELVDHGNGTRDAAAVTLDAAFPGCAETPVAPVPGPAAGPGRRWIAASGS